MANPQFHISISPHVPTDVQLARREFAGKCIHCDPSEAVELIETAAGDVEMLNEALKFTIMRNRVDVAELLLAAGAKPDRRISYSAGVLQSVRLFEALLKHGWDINAGLEEGKSSLMHVLGNESLVRWFFDHGAKVVPPSEADNPDLEDPPSSEFLDRAAWQSSIPTFDLLLEHGASLKGSLALHHAAGQPDRRDMMDHLINLGLNVNAVDAKRGNGSLGSPLAWAVEKSRSVNNVRFLLDRGADPHRVLARGASAATLAFVKGDKEIIMLCGER